MIRLIVKNTTCCPEGSITKINFETIDINCNKLEESLKNKTCYTDSCLIGCEIIKEKE